MYHFFSLCSHQIKIARTKGDFSLSLTLSISLPLSLLHRRLWLLPPVVVRPMLNNQATYSTIWCEISKKEFSCDFLCGFWY